MGNAKKEIPLGRGGDDGLFYFHYLDHTHTPLSKKNKFHDRENNVC